MRWGEVQANYHSDKLALRFFISHYIEFCKVYEKIYKRLNAV